MQLCSSSHWIRKRKRRPDITDDLIEYAIIHAPFAKDRRWLELYNAIAPVPPSGRTLKVVWKREKTQQIKIITAYWLN